MAAQGRTRKRDTRHLKTIGSSDMNCAPYEHGGFAYVINRENFYNVRKFDDLELKLLSLTDVVENDGVYTFAVFETDEGPEFHALRNSGIFELNTKHHAILRVLEHITEVEGGDLKIIMAGEMRVDDNNVVFNLLSGTYMKERFALVAGDDSEEPIKQSVDLVETKERAIQLFDSMLGGSSVITFEYTKDDLIKPVATTVELEQFKSLGATIFIFKASEQCVMFKQYETVEGKYKELKSAERNITRMERSKRSNPERLASIKAEYVTLNEEYNRIVGTRGVDYYLFGEDEPVMFQREEDLRGGKRRKTRRKPRKINRRKTKRNTKKSSKRSKTQKRKK